MENLKIYIDRLTDGQVQKFDTVLSPDFMALGEDELIYDDPINVHGEANIAEEHLVIQLSVETIAYLPCSICNDAVAVPIQMKNIYLTIPLSEIRGAIFDLTNEVRESILLQTPLFAECNNGKCPERENVKKFLKSTQNIPELSKDNHFPFADLDK